MTHELDAPPWRRFESTVMATSKTIRRAYDLRMSAIGLNLSEACLLAFVAEHGPVTQTYAAERIGMGRAAAGSIVDSLCGRSLLQRSPDPTDRRVWMLSVTESGADLCDRIAEVDRTLRHELREGLTRAERQQLAETLVKLQLNLARVLDGS